MMQNDFVLFNVDVDNYNGPLDVLLDLAKAQKVNLEDISITKLADQFHEYITKEKFKFRNSIRIFINGHMVSLSEVKIIITRNTRRGVQS